MNRPQRRSLRLYIGDSAASHSSGELQMSRHATGLELSFDLVFVVAIEGVD